MTNRTVVTRASRIALLAMALSLLVGALPVRAASAIDLSARPLVGGRFEVGGWMAIAVTLVNDGEPTEGYLSGDAGTGSVRRFVEMPAGANKVVTLYLQPEAFQRQVTVTYDEPNGSVATTVEVSVLERTTDQVAVAGDRTGTLRPQLLGAEEGGRPEPINIGVTDFPERPEPLQGLSAIVWAGDSAGLGEAQRRSIERWVSDGGQLVILGGADWQARTSGFAGLLPVEALRAVDDVPQAAMAAWSGAEAPAIESDTVASGTLRSGARALTTADDGTILTSVRALGAGNVIFVGVDLATDPYRGWEGSQGLWGRLVPTNALLEQFGGGDFPIKEEIQSTMNGALQTIPTFDVPPAELLLAVIVGYILLIGPISYIVLRRMDRRELAWVTAPLLIILFSACSFGIGRTLKGSDVVINQVSLIRTSPVGGAATVESYAGIFSPDRATYDLSVDADALIGTLRSDSGLITTESSGVVEQGDPARLRDLSIGVFGFVGVMASGIVDHQPSMSVTWHADEGEIVGTVTNVSDAAIADVAYISASGGERIGNLDPGASLEFTLPSANFNGSSAADQVYGFGGFEAGTEEQRVIAMRRQVISALVGFSGLSGPGIDIGTVPGRGPYLIGWRDDGGPMPVSVDDQQARRYASSVEVLSVRPTVDRGPVTIRPIQMGVSVVATDGETAPIGPATVQLLDGSATFGIALPIDAAGLRATGVDIIVGTDPSVAMSEPGSFGGSWGEGFSVEVLNPTTGQWTLVGDLVKKSVFEIDDPASALSSTDRIEVRVTGSGDPNMGTGSVFVTARVSGVIGE